MRCARVAGDERSEDPAGQETIRIALERFCEQSDETLTLVPFGFSPPAQRCRQLASLQRERGDSLDDAFQNSYP